MHPISEMPPEICGQITTIFSDIDDTITTEGLIPAAAYSALWHAKMAGINVIPVTGRPAGWCDHIARMWPVSAVVGENGALAFALIDGRIQRLWAERPEGAHKRLDIIRQRVLEEVPGCKVATDQPYREYDLAIDFCEEVPPLAEAAIDKIVAIFQEEGATAKVSSIHVNGWFGDFDKLTMCKRVSQELFGHALNPQGATFLGDSPNDVPMFAFFEHAIGVANVNEMAHRMDTLPAYICEQKGGEGFAEAVAHILRHRPEEKSR
jgi:HAD superfamily hydrolase (TIGR01484 family)